MGPGLFLHCSAVGSPGRILEDWPQNDSGSFMRNKLEDCCCHCHNLTERQLTIHWAIGDLGQYEKMFRSEQLVAGLPK